jgi:hypothetical protein
VLDISSCSSLFEKDRVLADSTSAICHAVFIRDRNYSGTPASDRHPGLAAAARQVHAPTSRSPKTPSSYRLDEPLQRTSLWAGTDPARVLYGFPHPLEPTVTERRCIRQTRPG